MPPTTADEFRRLNNQKTYAQLEAENERLRGEIESWKALVKDLERRLEK